MDGKVLSTGTLESMQPWLSRHEHVIDRSLRDQVILPGLIDPHTHLSISAGYLSLVYVGPIDSPGPQGMNPAVPSIEAMLQTLRRAHEAEPDRSKPLLAWGLDPAIQGGHLHRDLLDAISTERPIWVIAAPHFVYVNTPVLERSRVPADTTMHGVRYPDGRLSGVFVEVEATRAHPGRHEGRDHQGRGEAGMRMMAQTACRAGVTTTAEMVFGATDFESEWAMHETRGAARRVSAAHGPGALELPLFTSRGDQAAAFLQEQYARNGPKLFFKGVKLPLRWFLPGHVAARQLRLNWTAATACATSCPGTRWPTAWSRTGAAACGSIATPTATGGRRQPGRWPIAAAPSPRFDHRFTLEHYCINTPEQARRLKALGGVASVNNYVHYRSQLHSAVGYGPGPLRGLARLER